MMFQPQMSASGGCSSDSSYWQVFQGSGKVPFTSYILVTSVPLSNTSQWQLVHTATDSIPVEDVVCALQQRLSASGHMSTPQMVPELQDDGCSHVIVGHQVIPGFNKQVDLDCPPPDHKHGADKGKGPTMQQVAEIPTGYQKAPKNKTLEEHLGIWFPPSPRKAQRQAQRQRAACPKQD
mmetsp:Transcript_105608/g.147225  ORF Transcript_105608/g.147225 Transcript_105608/m.147225 type:complete len:179 (-) Transcript_105608:18-554(-)